METTGLKNELKPMIIRKILSLRGPNIWSHDTILECWVEFLPFMNTAKNWQNALLSMVPSLEPLLNQAHVQPDKPILASLLLSLTLHLQNEAGCIVRYGRLVPSSQGDMLRIIIQYKEEQVGRSAFDIACQLLEKVLAGENFNIQLSIEQLRSLTQQVCLGPSTLAIVESALSRGIPYIRLNEGSLVQLGWGSKQKKILAAATSMTSAIAEDIVQDKDLTRRLLHSVGLFVPWGRPVISAEDAWAAALELGLPVVIKPQDGNQGRGVALNLGTQEQIVEAYLTAREESKSIIIEQFIPGSNYRMLIVGRQLVAAARCEPAHVIGDGIQSVQKLIAEVNCDPRRAPEHTTPLSQICIDAVALAVLKSQGLTPDSIPEKGKKILIRLNGNLSTGGTAVDITAHVHSTIRIAAIEAAQTVGLDICGIDMIAQDISQPLAENNGVFIEINARPGLRMHLHPVEGLPQPVGNAIVNTLFSSGETGRIPIVAVTGVNGKTTTTRFIAHLLAHEDRKIGMCNTDGIFINKRNIDCGDCSGPKSARKLLSNPLVDLAVLETARGGILREGLGFDQCDVAVVTNIGTGDHLGIDEISNPEQLAAVKQCTVSAVPDSGTVVLNADDPLTAKMGDACTCRTIFFSLDPHNTVIQRHRKMGKKAIYTKNGSIFCAEGEQEFIFLPLAEIPLTQGGLITFQIKNALASIAAAWALGVELDLIRKNARDFTSSIDDNLGRFNILDIGGAIVVIDYVHNIDALRALLDALRHFQHQRRIITYSSAGDRRDCDIIEQGCMLGSAFDEIWLYEGNYVRGRKPGEIMELIAKGLKGASRAKRIEYVQGHLKAVDLMLETIRPGDLVVIQADKAEETVQHLKKKQGIKYEIPPINALALSS